MFSKAFIALSAFIVVATAQTPPFSGYNILETNKDSLTCLTAESLDNGAAVTVEPCNTQRIQSFLFQNGAATLSNGAKCLHVENGNNADGTLVQIQDCTPNNPDQQWYYTSDNRSVANAPLSIKNSLLSEWHGRTRAGASP